MSEDIQHHRDRNRTGWWIALIVVILPLVYMLSPPFVMMMVGPMEFGEQFGGIYAPLTFATVKFSHVADFYIWYFNLVTDDYSCIISWITSG